MTELTKEERDALTLAWTTISSCARYGLKEGVSEKECEPLRSAAYTIRKLLDRNDKNCDTSQPPVAQSDRLEQKPLPEPPNVK